MKTYIVKLNNKLKRVEGKPTNSVELEHEISNERTDWFTTSDPTETFLKVKEEGNYSEICFMQDSYRITIYEN